MEGFETVDGVVRPSIINLSHTILFSDLPHASVPQRVYLRANKDSLPNYRERQREAKPISTAWVESAINEIIAKRMAKSKQMRWNRWKMLPVLAVRTAVLNDALSESSASGPRIHARSYATAGACSRVAAPRVFTLS
jgi:hypothetical protein